MLTRRDLYRYGTFVLGSFVSFGLGIPGVAYVLDPLRRKGGEGTSQALARLNALTVGVPQAFPIIAERRDAWVKYGREPVGMVWLIRQPEGVTPPVLALNAECTHLGCPISANEDGKSFICRCHQAAFDLEGKTTNAVAPRDMDRLEVELSEGDDPSVIVKFRRYRTQSKEKIPLV